MNKLEQEIEEKATEYCKKSSSEVFQQGHKDDFKQGAQFILDKNLAVEFMSWYHENEDEMFDILETNKYTTQEAYDYWINNVYGL